MADAYVLEEPTGTGQSLEYSVEPGEATRSIWAVLWDFVKSTISSPKADSTGRPVMISEPTRLPLSAFQSDLVKNESLIRSFGQLPKGWNGYTADPIPQDVVYRALRLLRELPVAPEVFPTARESIQFEYDVGDRSLEIEIQKDSVVLLEAIGDEMRETRAESLLSVVEIVSAFHVAASDR